MIKTALSASLIALAVLAPVASAADEVKPPRQADQAAPTCQTTEPAVVDPKAPPAPRLSKAELEALKKLPLCSTEEPKSEPCPPYDKQAYYDSTYWIRTGSQFLPQWLADVYRRECRVDPVLGSQRKAELEASGADTSGLGAG